MAKLLVDPLDGWEFARTSTGPSFCRACYEETGFLRHRLTSRENYYLRFMGAGARTSRLIGAITAH
jgi:hypothetical protein